MLTTIERVLLLQDLDLFRFATTEHLAQLAALCQDLEFPAGKVLAPDDLPENHLFLAVRGALRSVGNGSEVRSLLSRKPLNLWEFFAGTQLRAKFETAEDSLLLVVPREEMEDLLSAEPELCMALLKHMAQERVSG